jgi:hypothetical protein
MGSTVVPGLDATRLEQREALCAVTDQVMGGMSGAHAAVARVDGTLAWHLRGEVSLENNGGFVQLSTTIPGAPADWSGYSGLRLRVRADGGTWWVSARTQQVRAPWQSWRVPLTTQKGWQTLDVPWSAFVPYRMQASIDWRQVTRVALLSVGNATAVDLAVASISWLRD